jgi:hypothetical protein
MIILKIIATVIVIVLLTLVIVASAAIIRHLWILHSVKCNHCGNTMRCCGICEHEGINQYMFECPKCGTLEYVPVIDVLNGKEEVK